MSSGDLDSTHLIVYLDVGDIQTKGHITLANLMQGLVCSSSTDRQEAGSKSGSIYIDPVIRRPTVQQK